MLYAAAATAAAAMAAAEAGAAAAAWLAGAEPRRACRGDNQGTWSCGAPGVRVAVGGGVNPGRYGQGQVVATIVTTLGQV